jgi:hypothetical protein
MVRYVSQPMILIVAAGAFGNSPLKDLPLHFGQALALQVPSARVAPIGALVE